MSLPERGLGGGGSIIFITSMLNQLLYCVQCVNYWNLKIMQIPTVDVFNMNFLYRILMVLLFPPIFGIFFRVSHVVRHKY